MKTADNERDIIMQLAKASLSDRENAIEIAGKHAIKILEKITELIDKPISDKDKLDEIRRIVFLFC